MMQANRQDIDPPINSILPLELEGIYYQVNGLQLLCDVSIQFPKEGTITIVGPNGAGKTLLLKICHGLLSPSKGRIRWANNADALLPSMQSMVFQRPIMLRRSAKDNLMFAMKASKVPIEQRATRLEQALGHAKLSSLQDRPAKKMSGGEQQRLALARCFALQPQILFLDEPTAHLDPISISHVERLIYTIAETGCQIVMVTHDLAQARRLGSHTAFMKDGRIEEFSETETFFSNPRSEALSAFLRGQDFNKN